MFYRPIITIVLLGFVCSSCSVFSNKKNKEEDSPFGPTGIPPELRVKKNDLTSTDAGSPATEVNSALAQHTKAEDIIWTGFDDTTANVSELQALFQKPKKLIWEKNEGVAKRRAIREGKCVMILFTNPKQNPICNVLNTELIGQKDFGDWAEKNLVRMEVDSSVQMATGEKRGDEVSQVAYVAEMKKRYKALGSPVIIMLSPQGELLAKYTGYKKGQGEFLWGQIKYSTRIGTEQYEQWAKSLEKRGYRKWSDQSGTSVLAKLSAYKDGQLILLEPDGNRFRCKESILSTQDQEWISTEKKKRGLQ